MSTKCKAGCVNGTIWKEWEIPDADGDTHGQWEQCKTCKPPPKIAPSLMKNPSKSFLDRADSAAFYEAWVGSVLSRAGLFTVHHPFDTASNRDHGQSWDLDVGLFHPNTLHYNNGDVRSLRSPLTPVEVKSLSLTFLNTDSYPFEDVLVCSQGSWLRKWPSQNTIQRDFLLVSRPTGSIVWVPKGTPVTLGHEVHDRQRNELYKAVKTTKPHLRQLADFVEAIRG